MRNSLETRLGIFFALCIIVAILVLETAGVSEYFKSGIRIHANFKSVQELKAGDLVKMAGVEVGRVKTIDLTNGLVRVTMKIKKDQAAAIKTDSKATIKFAGLMGQNFVSIDFGEAGGALYSSNDVLVVSTLLQELQAPTNEVSRFIWSQFSHQALAILTNSSYALKKQQAVLAEELNRVLQRGSIYEPQRFARVPLSDKTKELIAQKVQGDDLALLNRLLLDDAYPLDLARYKGPSPEVQDGFTLPTTEQSDLGSLLTKLESVAGEVQTMRKDLSTENLSSLLGPVTHFMEQNSNHLNVILGNVRKVTDQVADGKGSVGKLLFDDNLYNSAMAAVAGVQSGVSELKAVASDARTIMADVNSGKGTLGLLVRDDALYRETTNAMSNVRQIMEKVNQGQGSVGKLVNDDSFYKNVKVSLQKMDVALEGLEDQGPLTVLGMAIGKLF